MTSGNSGVVSFRLLQAVTKWIIKIKLDHANFLENFDRISEYSSKWILISGILSENIKANYTERYDSLLKMKNHVNNYSSNVYSTILVLQKIELILELNDYLRK